MRIGLVVPGGVSRDGERRVIPAILWLLERLTPDHDVHVVVPWQEEEPAKWRLKGATVHNLGGRRRTWVPRAVAELVRIHRERRIDVLHALWAGGPGQAAVAAARLCRRPVAVHVAGGELVWMPRVPYGNRRPWQRALARWVLKSADRVTAASESMLTLVRSRTGVEAIRVPLGVDTTTWIPEPPRRRTTKERAKLVSVASLTAVKDHPTLLRAVAELVRRDRNVELELVGLDTSHGVVPALLSALDLGQRVRLHGFMTQMAAHEIVRGCDIMVIASRHEAGPVAMLEAAAVGVPTVGTPVGHVAEWAPDAAVTFPFGDSTKLADAICALLDDEDRRHGLAYRAQARATAEDADFTAARFQRIYRELVSEWDHNGR